VVAIAEALADAFRSARPLADLLWFPTASLARIGGGMCDVNVPERLYIPMAVLLGFARIVDTPVSQPALFIRFQERPAPAVVSG
jgi:hypothetical protein